MTVTSVIATSVAVITAAMAATAVTVMVAATSVAFDNRRDGGYRGNRDGGHNFGGRGKRY